MLEIFKMIKNLLNIKGAMAIVFVIAPLFLMGQDSIHLKKGNEYFDLVLEHYGKNSDSLLHYLELSGNEYKKGSFWNEYIKILNAFAAVYSNKNDYQSSQKYAALALSESKKYLESTDLMYATSLGNSIYSLIYIGNFKKAISQFKDVLAIEKFHKDTVLIVGSLKNIGDAYINLGDTDEAIHFYNESLAVIEDNKEKMTDSWFSDIYKKRGIAYFNKKEYKLSREDFSRAKNAIPTKPDSKNYLAYKAAININYEIAKIHLVYNNLDSIKYFVNEAQKLCTGDYHDSKVLGFQLLGEYYLSSSEYPLALEFLTKAEKKIREQYEEINKLQIFSEIDKLLAEAYLGNGEPEKASILYKKAIVNLKSTTEAIDDILTPSIASIYHPYLATEIFVGLGETYEILYSKNKAFKYLEAAYESYKNASELISQVRNSFQEETSLLRYSEVALPIYEACIASSLKMYEYSGDKNYLIEAFEQNENSKAALLLESITSNTAIYFSNIPDSLKQKEKDYKLQISSLNRSLYDELNMLENQDEYKIEQLNRLLFSETEEYNELIRKFENEYPNYYELKYNLQTAKLEEIQQGLSNSKTQLIEFFFGDDNIYVFSVTNQDIEINVVDNHTTLTSDIQKIKDFLSTPPNGNNIETELVNYVQTSKHIYDTVLKKSIRPESEHIIFITDGPLGYIPFEALITNDPSSSNVSYSLENLSYLIEDLNISYSYSATLFLDSYKKENFKNDHTFIGIAPSFGALNGANTRVCNENALSDLQCSEDEVLRIQDKLGGKVLLGIDATLENTKREIAKSKIIHLATHACLDDTNPEFNKIYLSDDYITNNDLYNLKLNSVLTVLSACETGSGKLAKGEGVMSLARGFIHAGCPSIVMSLWSIDDCATSEIMVDFYNELSNGKSKSDALRNSKLKYINEAKRANQHPYYWAAFVQIGNYNPIELQSTNYYYLLLMVLLMVGLFYFFKKR